MVVRVTFIVVCALSLLWAIGPKQQQTHTQQKMPLTVASDKGDGTKVAIKKITTAQARVDNRLTAISVPTRMLKNGKLQKLSREQKRDYAILTVFFRNDPIMVKVAACESSLRHTLPGGQLNVSPDGHDVGTFQVRLPVHKGELGRYGLNPADFTHNVAFATHLYRRDGLRHWNSSRPCWETLRFLA